MEMASRSLVCLALVMCFISPFASAIHKYKRWPVGGSTRFYDFKVQTMEVTKLCKSTSIVTINGVYPGPVLYAEEDDRVVVKVTNESPYNVSIHWHGVRQRLSCWSDGPAYITQCPIQAGHTYTYEFTVYQQKGTLFYHAHISWLRATLHGAIIIYPKTGFPYPFPNPYDEHVIILGEWWNKNLFQMEQSTLASGGAAPPADAFVINGHPGPLYSCSEIDVYNIDAVPGKTYLLRIVNTGLNTDQFFSISRHKLTVVEADGEYTKPFVADHLMLGLGQTVNVLVQADQPINTYEMAIGPYVTAKNLTFQNITAIAHFRYSGAGLTSLPRPAVLPFYNNSLVVSANMDALKSLEVTNLFRDVDEDLFFTIGLNVEQCDRQNPNSTCQGPNGGIFAASMNNISFIAPNVSLLQAYYNSLHGIYTDDFPGLPMKNYDFVNGAPNNSPDDTNSVFGTRVKVLEYGAKVQLIMQDTGTVTTESHPMHLHGYSFYVIGYGFGNYNPTTAKLNLVDPPLMNTVNVPVGGWAAIRFIADNPGVWFMHCHIDLHLSWGLSMVFIVKNGDGLMETLPPPPADLPNC